MSNIDPDYDHDAFLKDKDEQIGLHWLDYSDVEDPRDKVREILAILGIVLGAIAIVCFGIGWIQSK